MKIKIQNIAIPLLLFFAIGAVAQTSPSTSLTQVYANTTSRNNTTLNHRSPVVSIEELAASKGIPYREIANLDTESGYYLISAVFSKNRYAKRAVKKYKKQGFDSGLIFNPEDNRYYVFLDHYTDGRMAIDACSTDLGGHYDQALWILHITPGTAAEQTGEIALEEVTHDMIERSESSEEAMKGHPVNKSKLIQKADSYFNKMWYAEAAKLYEQALTKNENNYSLEILQKAGDSYYFNTNMEKAYHWYNILYDRYKDDLSPEHLFKYAHTLKGTGKYGRAKRLMRLYDREMDNSGLKDAQVEANRDMKEAVLDNILKMEQVFGVQNLKINSEYSEFSPMFHNNGQIVYASSVDTAIFATRKYKWNNQPYLDLYVAQLNTESQELTNAHKFSKTVNTKYHEASVTFSPDHETMYFTRNNYGKRLKRDKKGVNHLKIYRSVLVNGEWTEATEVSFNSDDYSTGHPALSPDGKKLYFVSDMPGSIGQTDIFVVDVLEGGEFSAPRNLGPDINTERKEMFPFINEGKLYFSSDGHVGLGGLDVFEAAIDEAGGFLAVKNLGQPINSNKDDFSYIVNEENEIGFFASNRKGGKGDDDLYSFKRLKVEEVPENLNAIAGTVIDLVTGDLMPQTMVTLLDDNNIKLKEMVVADDGSFLFEDLDGNTKYIVQTKKGDYFDEAVAVSTKENEVVHTDIAMRRLKEMIVVEEGVRKLKTDKIFFDFDKFNIKSNAAEELDKLVQVMTENPKMIIKIESHTDSRGKRAYNKYLSDQRAKSTRDYIISKGIDAHRIESAIGYGEERLINECDGTVRCTESAHLLNRRSEFIIVDM